MNTFKKILIFLDKLTAKKRFWAFVIFLFIIFSAGATADDGSIQVDTNKPTYEYQLIKGPQLSENKILAIHVTGVILDENSGNPFDFLQGSATYGSDVKEMLKRAAEDKSVKGVLIEISSPGGTITGSKAISDGIEYYREKTKNPVYAHITGEGMSGGYWSAAATDKIIAEYGSMTGSIGVILGPMKQYNKVLDESDASGSVGTRDGIDTRYFTAGKYKDTGSPYRPLSDEEEKHWQSMMNNEYDMFVDHVAKRRNLTKDYIQNTVKALPYGNKAAIDLKLIDENGSQEETLKQLAEKAGLKENEYQFIEEKRDYGLWNTFFAKFSVMTNSNAKKACHLCSKPLFLHDPTKSLITNY